MTGGQPQTWFFLAGSDIRKMHEFGRHLLQNSSKAETFMTLMYREFWTYLADFRSEYQEKFKADPYVCKVIQYLWDKGKLISQDRWQEAVDEVLLHNTWFLEHLLNDEKTIMIVPRYKLDYRDEYLPVPENRGFEGFDSNLHTSLTGVTNLIVPGKSRP
ncbi:glutamyl-tRNA(Gln) amidotransferase [Colletotrichum limetticola]|uniref:Glutamyl-tRNA(Gln) amidotransferase n=1 Tax=Colletotrichum limetticola TaxID=1209924 RepID=A0ABQ9QB35_9PEZI|nr:glutamyl-tRNA(Gln) amidotransferase [Colletotrichum limetticola]